MSRERGLTRRRLLSGLATVGSVGAVSGAGAVGLFSDEEVFTGNLLTAGELDLQVCWGENGDSCTPQNGPISLNFGAVEKGDQGRATIQCNLDDNPGWTWLRTNCPDGPCGLQEAVTVSLWYDWSCDGEPDGDEPYVSVSLDKDEQDAVNGNLSSAVGDISEPIEIRDLSLCDALTLLKFGTLLDSDPSTESEDPIEPGDWCCLGFKWSVDEYICVDDSFELNFEFYTKQWRHNSDPRTPWPDVLPCDISCSEDCQDCSDKQGISFVAFCIEDGEIQSNEIQLRPYYDIEGEVYQVEWESDVALDWVILKYANTFENFYVDGDTFGVVHVNSKTHTPDDEDYHSTEILNDGYTDLGQCPRDPCPDLSGATFGCGVKYNFNDSTGWESVCGQSCPGE